MIPPGKTLVRPKGTGTRDGLQERRRTTEARLGRIVLNGDWWEVTANGEGVHVRKWHSSERYTFTLERLIKHAIGILLPTTPSPVQARR